MSVAYRNEGAVRRQPRTSNPRARIGAASVFSPAHTSSTRLPCSPRVVRKAATPSIHSVVKTAHETLLVKRNRRMDGNFFFEDRARTTSDSASPTMAPERRRSAIAWLSRPLRARSRRGSQSSCKSSPRVGSPFVIARFLNACSPTSDSTIEVAAVAISEDAHTRSPPKASDVLREKN